MAGFLLDENLPPAYSDGLQLLGFDVLAIDRGLAPRKGASDEEVIEWCIAEERVLVTRDRGRKNPEMLRLLARTYVSALMLMQSMSNAQFVRNFVQKYDTMTADHGQAIRRGGAYRRKMHPGGRLQSL